MKKLFFTIFGLGILISLIYPLFYYNSSKNITIKINNKERITVGSGKNIESKFIIYTENEVFENTDDFFYLKFNSADFQNNLKIDNIYTVKVVGWRIPFFSIYRNIIQIYENKNQ